MSDDPYKAPGNQTAASQSRRMGNTQDIAEAYYIQEMEQFRATAAQNPTTGTKGDVCKAPDKKRQKVVHDSVQQRKEMDGTGRKPSVSAGA